MGRETRVPTVPDAFGEKPLYPTVKKKSLGFKSKTFFGILSIFYFLRYNLRMVYLSFLFIQIQLYILVAIFVFAKPLDIDRSAILSDLDFEESFVIDRKLKLILKPQISLLDILKETPNFSLPNLIDTKLPFPIFKPPISS
jgi:hypothetical protein